MAKTAEVADAATVSFKLTHYHRDLLTEAARQAGVTVSTYLRELLIPILEGASPPPELAGPPPVRSPVDIEALHEALASTMAEVVEARRECRQWMMAVLSATLLQDADCTEEEARKQVTNAAALILG